MPLDTNVGGAVPQVPVFLTGAKAVDARTAAKAKWTYEEAFKRNRGLITEEEQEKLRNSRVAIAGMGGVGGAHLITLARLGIGKFTIADPDVFDVANFNRQYGATISNLGRNKAEAMAEAALDVNPELDLRVFPKAIDESNVDAFLKDANLFVDGLDFFAIEARRLVFRRVAELGLWAITAGPMGFSAAWLVFDPNGTKFDDFFNLHDSDNQLAQQIAFAVGLAPKATHVSYMDLSHVKISERTGPSSATACQLASGMASDAALQVILHGKFVAPVPAFFQFDSRKSVLRSGRLRNGNRSILQRLKQRITLRRLLGVGTA